MSNNWTEYADLNGVLSTFRDEVASILDDRLVGIYLQGSFSLHEGDIHSDCDFLVVIDAEPTVEQLGRLVLLHDAIPRREGHWNQHLEGSYAIRDDLRDLSGLGNEWWYVDHGSRAITKATHCNREVVRWTLREHGIVLAGPDPRDFMDPVPPAALRDRSRADLETVVQDILSWATLDIAWVQRYLVATTCRIAYTLQTAEVTSKRLALEWAMDTFDPEWRALLQQALDDRPLGFVLMEMPREGSVERSLAFVDYVRDVTKNW